MRIGSGGDVFRTTVINATYGGAGDAAVVLLNKADGSIKWYKVFGSDSSEEDGDSGVGTHQIIYANGALYAGLSVYQGTTFHLDSISVSVGPTSDAAGVIIGLDATTGAGKGALGFKGGAGSCAEYFHAFAADPFGNIVVAGASTSDIKWGSITVKVHTDGYEDAMILIMTKDLVPSGTVY